MEDWKTAFAEPWDAVVLGTGLKECLLSGLLSVAGKKVLHLDRNAYYGGASASLDIHQLFKKFGVEEPPTEAAMGKLRDYSVDLVPKFIMAGGLLVKVLIHTGVANYMEFKPVEGSFVFSSKAQKICKVPAGPEDAMKSSLMGMMEKTRMVQFTLWVAKCKTTDRSTWKAGTISKTTLALDTMSGDKFFAYWGLEKPTIEFLTHACCLYRDDSFKTAPAIELVKRMQLYLDSKTRFPGMTSPYLYPLYGLGELPQSFARLAAVHGGTYMLNRGDDDGPVFGEAGEFTVKYDESGVAEGIEVMGVTAKAKIVVGDPSYFAPLVTKKGAVIRAIVLSDTPVESANNAASYQVIFPGASVGRTNDIYLFCCGNSHKVAPDGKFIIFVSTTVEGDCTGLSTEAIAQKELSAGLALVKDPIKIFYDTYDLLAPKEDGAKNKVFISESFDATTHFETAINDVLAMYERIMGEKLVLTDGPPQQ
uniref:Rab GDP dissociation inhibitor n=1 Tax=Haptolina brevifila TaxID=156173 RepID=A0A6U7ILG1_9EUKA|mmetsp:Transcript_59064/g.117372  ORF Transcript_59064/g.117372 Transcript_59064/m.117372 type:complete len:477 (+) Transcript_59064:22-1452(+)|eukprot:CAMPEP_0174715460 /NCGR_PEP_ID=MMETSP1094-20130205/21230_1 /TAXON_ID=156173 /ORGANISM="Chrysochromulina brevifilum, Strain UTEX LB 985" /LENGTH=476 /DNA_ID=CAMNT_0015915029 /DNA_START=22 /DNA_END=1452 /DNA_ORIENTATION=-